MELFVAPSGTVRRIPAAGMLLLLALALASGLGGILIAGFGWPAIFLINLPFGLAGLAIAARIDVHFTSSPDPAARFDLIGLLLLSLGLALSLYGISEGPQEGWQSIQVFP